MADNSEYTRLVAALKDDGFRMTGPRRAMLRALSRAGVPLSVQQIHDAANQILNPEREAGEEELDLVTAYRFANLLSEKGLAQRIELNEGYFRYEIAESSERPHHHHLVCRTCGKIEDFQHCGLDHLTERLEKESGFRVDEHKLEIFGTCPACITADAAKN